MKNLLYYFNTIIGEIIHRRQRLGQQRVSQAAACGGGGGKARLQPVAQAHQLIDLADDAVLFGEGRQGTKNRRLAAGDFSSYIYYRMELEWDEGKRKANLRKHGLDFDDARRLDWDNATYLEDTRLAYPEPRFWTFAKDKAGRLHVVTFCIRGTKVRIISFRKANRREVNRHG